uniref:26S proteasome regulatory subunit Rpn7 N-terminal domain-containing protein n=1 Tax=Romanomermis culicivorax TaxID=13658 RepID=A0A915I1P4_ROMCU
MKGVSAFLSKKRDLRETAFLFFNLPSYLYMPIQVPSAALSSAMTSVAVAEPMDFCSGDLGGYYNGDREYTDNDQVVINPTLDLEAYANNYKGLAKINRLLFIADRCPPLRNDALQIALTYVQQNTLNWAVYQKIHQKMIQHCGNFSGAPDVASDAQKSGTFNGLSLQYDQTWVDQTMKKGVMKTEKLDTDLKHYKSNSIKESIRRGQDDLGEHYLDMGDVINALKCFSRARDYCTTNKHIIQMCFNVIKVSAYASNWALVTTYVNRAEATPELSQ